MINIKNLSKFALPCRKQPFIIENHHSSQFLPFTFLQSNLQFIASSWLTHHHYLPKSIDQTTLQLYSSSISQHISTLHQLQKQEISTHHLSQINTNQAMSPIVKLYQKIKHDIEESIRYADTEELGPLTVTMTVLNIMDKNIWNKILMKYCKKMESLTIQDKHLLFLLLKSYLFKYEKGWRSSSTYKFVFYQTHIKDLFDFNFLIRRMFQYNVIELKTDENPEAQFLKKESLDDQMKIVIKVSKAVDINTYFVKKMFQKKQSILIHYLRHYDLSSVLFMYEFLTLVNCNSQSTIETIETELLRKLNFASLNIYVVNKIISNWKNRYIFNAAIFHNFILPFLESSLQTNFQNNNPFYINIAFSLLCSNIPDTSIISKILDKLPESSTKTKNYHIIKHCLLLRQLKAEGKPTELALQECSKYQQTQQIQGIEFNSIEKFWFSIIKSIPDIKCYKNKYVCAYQIDIMVKYKGKYLAIQIQGGHYQRKEGLSGKRVIKEEILKNFDIHVINLHCEEQRPKMIMRFNQMEKGKQFMIQLLEQRASL